MSKNILNHDDEFVDDFIDEMELDADELDDKKIYFVKSLNYCFFWVVVVSLVYEVITILYVRNDAEGKRLRYLAYMKNFQKSFQKVA